MLHYGAYASKYPMLNDVSGLSSSRARTGVLLAPVAVALLLSGCSTKPISQSSPVIESKLAPHTTSTDNSARPVPGNDESSSVDKLTAKVVATHPFSEDSFTQGLEVTPDGELLVGTGQTGESRIYRAKVRNHEVEASAELDDTQFGEGITQAGDHVWQLTWKDGVAIKRDPKTLQETGRAPYDGEGWGLCAFEDTMFMSDGSSQLQRLAPDSFDGKADPIKVTLDGSPVDKINELECVTDRQGERHVFANVWFSTDILRIDPESGHVTGIVDASGLDNNADPRDADNVLNGIAYDPSLDLYYLTGKRWPDLYEVRFEPAS